jgi:hypothetical protein
MALNYHPLSKLNWLVTVPRMTAIKQTSPDNVFFSMAPWGSLPLQPLPKPMLFTVLSPCSLHALKDGSATRSAKLNRPPQETLHSHLFLSITVVLLLSPERPRPVVMYLCTVPSPLTVKFHKVKNHTCFSLTSAHPEPSMVAGLTINLVVWMKDEKKELPFTLRVCI